MNIVPKNKFASKYYNSNVRYNLTVHVRSLKSQEDNSILFLQ